MTPAHVDDSPDVLSDCMLSLGCSPKKKLGNAWNQSPSQLGFI